MNLLANQLTLSSIELRNSRQEDALNRLIETQKSYPSNYILKNNISVIKCLKHIKNNPDQSNQNKPQLATSINETILVDPLNYMGYYNLFNLNIKQKQYPQALKHLISAIAALHLQKALQLKQQKTAKMVLKDYCSDSVLVYLVKSIIHVKHQKYIIAVSDLNWIIENTQNKKDKIQVLNLIKIIFSSLDQKDKQSEVEQQIQALNTAKQYQNSSNECLEGLKLCCTSQIPQSPQTLNKELSRRLKEFAHLLTSIEANNFKISLDKNQVLFKQIDQKELNRTPMTKQSLLQQLTESILWSPLVTKSEQKSLSRSRKSLNISITESQQLPHNHQQPHNIPSQTSKQPQQTGICFSMPITKKKFDPLMNSMDEVYLRKQSTSLISTGTKGKKKTQNIYPLETTNQEVEVKLVMAQLAKNQELPGQIQPYCLISYNGQQKTSSVVKSVGLEPRWKEGFMFNLSQQPSQVLIQVFHKQNQPKKDHFVGSGKILLQKNGFLKISLLQKEKQAGTIFITVQAKF